MARAFGPTMIEKIRLGYADLDTTLEETAARVGVHKGTIVNLARKCGWPKRREASAALRRPTVQSDPATREAGSGQLARLERISAQSAARIEAALSDAAAIEPERAARALALHVRTLEGIRKLQSLPIEEPPRDDEPPPRSLAELRDELRGHLERIWIEERDQALRGVPEPG